MSQAPITPDVLIWARKRSGLTHEQLSKNFAPVEKIKSWEDGEASPSFAQADTLAGKLKIPLLVLFLPERPQEHLPLPDLRTLSGATPHAPSPEFLDAVNDAVVRQQWYREQLETGGARRLSFVGQYRPLQSTIHLAAAAIRATLHLDERLRLETKSWSEFLVRLVQRSEEAGILVMRSSVVRNDNTRKLRVDEFRGFAISDPYAPLVFINTRDPKAAQIFTLGHELAHIWCGATGISNFDPRKAGPTTGVALEQYCNAVAAEVLVPANDFLKRWDSKKKDETNIDTMTSFYRVSSLVALRRAFELGKITREYFFERINAEYERFRKSELKEVNKEEARSGNFWNLFTMRNSQKFTDSVAIAAQEGRVPYVFAGSLLGVKASTVETYFAKFHG
jgi:Zn-dependent peptidase ImmA (M78 family)